MQILLEILSMIDNISVKVYETEKHCNVMSIAYYMMLKYVLCKYQT